MCGHDNITLAGGLRHLFPDRGSTISSISIYMDPCVGFQMPPQELTRGTTSSTRLPQRTKCVLVKELSLGCYLSSITTYFCPHFLPFLTNSDHFQADYDHFRPLLLHYPLPNTTAVCWLAGAVMH